MDEKIIVHNGHVLHVVTFIGIIDSYLASKYTISDIVINKETVYCAHISQNCYSGSLSTARQMKL